mgnify:FL=1
MKTSFIILDRKILDWQWYQNPRIFRVFLHCLLKANWKDKKWMGKKIKRGSFVTSQLKLSKELSLSRSTIQRSLKVLESGQCLVTKTGNKFTTITICNYDSYQSTEKSDGHQMGTKRASNGHQTGTTNNNNNKNKENNIYIYSEEYFKNAKLVKGVCENQRITESKLRSEMQEFIINLENKGAYSNDFTHFKQHFFSFLKKRNTKGLKEGFVRYIDDRVI